MIVMTAYKVHYQLNPLSELEESIFLELDVRQSADISILNRFGGTALIPAADIHLADSNGISPLQHAKNRGYLEMVEMLKE
jgi:ankyrin repeat protein